MPAEPYKYIYRSTLKSRGWTDGAIKKFLGEPDLEKPNPHYRSGPPSSLYLRERAETVEQSDQFKEWYQKSLSRRAKLSAASKATADRKREQLLKLIESLNIQITKYKSESKLYKKALAHYKDLWEMREDYERASITRDECSIEFLRRISANMLRHICNQYEEQLYDLVGKVGRADAYWLLRERIDAEIEKHYPYLAGY